MNPYLPRFPSRAASRSGPCAGKRPARLPVAAFLVFATLSTSPAMAREPPADERALWRLWTTHTNNLSHPETVIAACGEFESNRPGDLFLDVCRGIAAWHFLQSGRTTDARGALDSMRADRPGNPLAEAADQMARAWITRLNREQVKEALQRFYAAEIAFPESLEELQRLPPDQRPPLTDVWGNPWRYSLRSFRFLKGIDNQRYVLESRTLGPRSDLTTALQIPYAQALGYTPVRILSRTGSTPTVAFNPPASRITSGAPSQIVASAGSRLELARFAYMGERLIILADTEHWNLLIKP